MIRRSLLALPLLLTALEAGEILRVEVRDGEGRPLAGARVRGSGRESATDKAGVAGLEVAKGRVRVEVSREGFQTVSREVAVEGPQSLRFTLRPESSATVVVVSAPVTEVKPLLMEDIIATETVGPREIQRTNALSLNEAVDCRPGVTVQTECSICNVRNVVLNNLPGRFTTIMIDGVPIFSSVSGAYGLDMVGVNGVESVEVSRGAGVSLVAPEALAGTVNVVSRRPEKAENMVALQGGAAGERRVDGFLGRTWSKGAWSASFLGARQESRDANGNGVSEYAGFDRALAGFAFFAEDVAGFSLRARLDVVDEQRGGGASGADYAAIKASRAGNPFVWNGGQGGSPDPRGWIRPDGDFAAAQAAGQNPILLGDGRVLLPYDGGRGGFSEIIGTQRQQALLVATRDLASGARIKASFGYARHDQDSFYEGDVYRADQIQRYGELSLQMPWGETLVTAGISDRFEDLRSRGLLGNGTPIEGLDNYRYRTPAAFLQAYRAFLGGRLEVNASLRHDRNNVFGNLTTPRLSLLWHHGPATSSRFALGRGFRVPTSFFEQDHGILSTTRIDREIQRPELSDNASYAFSTASSRYALTASVNYNRIGNYALLDSSAVDAGSGAPVTRFTQAPDPITFIGADATLTWRFRKHLEGTVGAEATRYSFTPGVLSFARPERRFFARIDWEGERGEAFLRAQWTGAMDLSRFYAYGRTRRYNLDGTPKLDRSPGYWTLDAGGSVKLRAGWEATFNVANLLGYVQTGREDFLWVDAAGNPDVTHIWGPARGRAWQIGLRAKF